MALNERMVLPAEASAFLAFVGIAMAFLVGFYLYITKRFCFTSDGICCHNSTNKLTTKSDIKKELGLAFGYDHADLDDEELIDGHDVASTSDESEEDVLRRIERSTKSRGFSTKRYLTTSSSGHCLLEHGQSQEQNALVGSKHTITSAAAEVRRQHERRTSHLRDTAQELLIRAAASQERRHSRSPPIEEDVAIGTMDQASTPNPPRQVASPSGSIKPIIDLTSSSGCESRRRVVKVSNRTGTCVIRSDPASLAEKGRIGKTSSGSSESGSADTEEENAPFLRLQAKNKALGCVVTDSRPSSSGSSETRPMVLMRGQSTESNPSTNIQKNPSLKQSYENTVFKTSQDSDGQASSGSRCLSRQTTISSIKGQPSGSASNDGQNVAIKVGYIEVAHTYDAPTKKLQVTVIGAKDIPSKDRGGFSNVAVRVVLLPYKRQKLKTKTMGVGDGNVQFSETFTFTRISPEEVLGLGVRFRLYGCERLRREHLVGEGVLAFSCSKPLQHETRLRISLEPRCNLSRTDSRSDVSSLARSDSTGSTQSMAAASSPELLLGMAYKGTTGRLQVTVIKGSQFRALTMSRAPDTHVKMTLVSSTGQEIGRSKTTVRRGQPNPLFKETFVFQVALFQLPDVTLMVSVYSRRSMKRKKEMIGWFSLGLNSSGDEEHGHWNEMRDSNGEQVCRWHVLLES